MLPQTPQRPRARWGREAGRLNIGQGPGPRVSVMRNPLLLSVLTRRPPPSRLTIATRFVGRQTSWSAHSLHGSQVAQPARAVLLARRREPLSRGGFPYKAKAVIAAIEPVSVTRMTVRGCCRVPQVGDPAISDILCRQAAEWGGWTCRGMTTVLHTQPDLFR